MTSHPSTAAAPRRGKNIVIFADGTGSSFTSQETNIWRLYKALDKAEKPAALQQLARYIPGVGTSGNRVLRLIDGATGIGVPSNVRKLYRFLCWNWEPGDHIYLFGFSRGAFTVRTLAGMLRFQGLMPVEINGRRVTDAEMKRNSMRAWERYRELTAPLWQDGLKMAPYIGLIRWLRDRAISTKRRIFKQPTHDAVLLARPAARRPALGSDAPPTEAGGQVSVQYMGLFDTVEAYGFPHDGLRRVWSTFVWPITFRNRVCSKIVTRADHVLALDDERLTFHPIQFDQRQAGTKDAPTVVREVWFSGMHSDVGGGYPDDAVAMDALLWIMDAAQNEGLQFSSASRTEFAGRVYPRAVIHDSRAGLAAAYRYEPRPKLVINKLGGPLVLHKSVVDKIKSGADGYAPLLLPAAPNVCSGPESHATCDPAKMSWNATADAGVRKLVWWRSWVNRALLIYAALFILVPLLENLGKPLRHLWAGLKEIVWSWYALIGLDAGPLRSLYQDVWPWALLLAAVIAGLWWWAGDLQSRIKDQALKVWKVTD